jgi:adenosylcobinamide-GDP ribazoletransferase
VSFLRQYLVAVQFFTRMPVTSALAQWPHSSPDVLRASAAHFPGVGWLAGLLATSVFALLGMVLPDSTYAPLAAAVGCTIATVWLTGGVHENSLARVVDSWVDPAQALGALALPLALMAKVSLLAVLAGHSPTAVLAALFAAQVLSRFWPLLLVRSLPYVGDASATSALPLVERTDHRALGVAAAWCVMPLGIAIWAQGIAFMIVAMLLSGLALWGLRTIFQRQLQGFRDDCLGAAQQVCEIAFYLGAAIGLVVG